MATGKRAENTLYIRECMADAFIELLKEKPDNKITAQDIAEKANTGRATWFRNFNSREDAIAFRLNRLWDAYLVERGMDRETIPNDLIGKEFMEFNYGIRDLLRLLCGRGYRYSLYDAYYKIIHHETDTDTASSYIARFGAYGMVGILDEWIQRDFRETPEELLRLTSELLQPQK